MNRLIRIAVIGFAFCLFPFMAGAQSFGLKAGMNFSSINNGAVKDNIGYQAGLTYQIDFPLWFSIQPELMFHVKGGRVGTGGESDAFGLGYLEIPVNIQWGPRFKDGDVRVFLQGTPFIGYAISRDMRDADGNQYDWKNINRFEYGVGAGLGIQLWHFQITGQYNWSFGDLTRQSQAEAEFKEMFSKSNFGGYTLSLAILF